MRMIVPPISSRREIDRNLAVFFREHRRAHFRSAISEFCRFYNVRPPRIEWYEYIDWGKTAGKTFEDGRIQLVHPENWKRGRVYRSERMWVQTVYHEIGHYLFWTDAERKADVFTHRMVRGLRRRRMRGCPSARPAHAARQRPLSRSRRRLKRLPSAGGRNRRRRSG